MIRLPAGYVDAIAEARAWIPGPVLGRLRGVDFLCGVDPVFAGLHVYDLAEDGRSYRDTAHCVYPFHQVVPRYRRRTTVVLPVPEHPAVVIHELGHALHELLDFVPDADPVSEYARTDRFEAFAEAFRLWIGWRWPGDSDCVDPVTSRLLEDLCS